jgi:hypothetical protein
LFPVTVNSNLQDVLVKIPFWEFFVPLNDAVYCCNYIVSVLYEAKMRVKRCWNDTDREKRKYSNKNLLSITPASSFALEHGVDLKSAYYGDRPANDLVIHSAAFRHVAYISTQYAGTNVPDA